MPRDIITIRRRGGYFVPVAAGSPTTFDPAIVGAQITLSGGNLTATLNTFPATTGYTQSTTSYTSGQKYCEFTTNQITNPTTGGSWVVGLFNTTRGYPNEPIVHSVAYWVPANAGSPLLNPVTSYISGTTIAIAVDFGVSKMWVRSTGNSNWNNDVIGNQNPVGNVGGLTILGGTGVLGDTFGIGINLTDAVNDSVTANFGTLSGGVSSSNGTWLMTPPTGYTNW